MRCKSKFAKDPNKYIYDYIIIDDEYVQLIQDKFNIKLSKLMFNMFFEPIDDV